jgi:hypothetical protein
MSRNESGRPEKEPTVEELLKRIPDLTKKVREEYERLLDPDGSKKKR